MSRSTKPEYNISDEIPDLTKSLADYEQQQTDIEAQVDTEHLYKGCDPKSVLTAREAFLAYLVAKGEFPTCNKKRAALRDTHPETATITLDELLGKKGTALYSKAIEEESKAESYRRAVLEASTSYHRGNPWTRKPAIIIAGPSGCGKSYSSQVAIRIASKLLSTQHTASDKASQTANPVVSIDGGIAREISQIRSLVLQIAMRQGYTGIQDLSSHDEALRNIKKQVYQCVLHKNIGLVIPKTFVNWFSPGGGLTKEMKELSRQADTQLMFCPVQSKVPKRFKETVRYIASRRAWQAAKESKPLTLNHADIPESKAPETCTYIFAVLGSQAAESWIMKHNPQTLVVSITNDLRLLKPAPKDKNAYVDASPHDSDAFVVSDRLYQYWQDEKPSHKMTLKEYIEKREIVCSVTGTPVRIANGLWWHYKYLLKPKSSLAEWIGKYEDCSVKAPIQSVLNFIKLEIKKILDDTERKQDTETPRKEWEKVLKPTLKITLQAIKTYDTIVTSHHLTCLVDGMIRDATFINADPFYCDEYPEISTSLNQCITLLKSTIHHLEQSAQMVTGSTKKITDDIHIKEDRTRSTSISPVTDELAAPDPLYQAWLGDTRSEPPLYNGTFQEYKKMNERQCEVTHATVMVADGMFERYDRLNGTKPSLRKFVEDENIKLSNCAILTLIKAQIIESTVYEKSKENTTEPCDQNLYFILLQILKLIEYCICANTITILLEKLRELKLQITSAAKIAEDNKPSTQYSETCERLDICLKLLVTRVDFLENCEQVTLDSPPMQVRGESSPILTSGIFKFKKPVEEDIEFLERMATTTWICQP